MTKVGEIDSYWFYAIAGAVGLVTVSGNDAVADVYGPDGSPIGSCTNGATPLFSLTKSGTCTVLVHAADYTATGGYGVSPVLTSWPAPWLAISTTNGAAALSVWGVIGNAYSIEYVTNFPHCGALLWSALTPFTLTDFTLPYSPLTVLDPSSTNSPRRFYRVTPWP
jgi:hypothetical protein